MIKFKLNVFHYRLMMQGYKPEKEKSLSLAQPPLSFEQVCPTWARKLRIGLDEQDVRTLAFDSKYCIVGEAWGYNGRHAGYYVAPLIPLIGCWKCVKFGREMGKIAKLHGQSCTSDLHPVINRFIEHWNKRHRDNTKKNTLHFSVSACNDVKAQ
jgi:hypothetical protein